VPGLQAPDAAGQPRGRAERQPISQEEVDGMVAMGDGAAAPGAGAERGAAAGPHYFVPGQGWVPADEAAAAVGGRAGDEGARPGAGARGHGGDARAGAGANPEYGQAPGPGPGASAAESGSGVDGGEAVKRWASGASGPGAAGAGRGGADSGRGDAGAGRGGAEAAGGQRAGADEPASAPDAERGQRQPGAGGGQGSAGEDEPGKGAGAAAGSHSTPAAENGRDGGGAGTAEHEEAGPSGSRAPALQQPSPQAQAGGLRGPAAAAAPAAGGAGGVPEQARGAAGSLEAAHARGAGADPARAPPGGAGAGVELPAHWVDPREAARLPRGASVDALRHRAAVALRAAQVGRSHCCRHASLSDPEQHGLVPVVAAPCLDSTARAAQTARAHGSSPFLVCMTSAWLA